MVDLLLDAQCRNDVTTHNEHVKNWVTLRRFIDAVCPLANHSCSGGSDETSTSLNEGTFVG